MTQPACAKDEPDHEVVSTILSNQVMIPISCDHCHHDTDVSLHQLKHKTPILCEHCYEVHHISDTELQLIRLLLAKAGYHFTL